ncbi:hypothetical protein [Streptomyces fumanus]|uniref:hypothetical protein n=1 Tax=Streptomyces fumanus TaxID=67302 RepID=UPI003403DB16
MGGHRGRHGTRAAVTLCAAAALAAPLGAASAAPATDGPARQGAREPSVLDCAARPEVRPGAFLLACGDANSRLVSLHWARWDARAAVGRGVNQVNDCVPYCAVGTFRSYPVTVRLDSPDDRSHFTRISLTYSGERPAGAPRTVSYPLPG